MNLIAGVLEVSPDFLMNGTIQDKAENSLSDNLNKFYHISTYPTAKAIKGVCFRVDLQAWIFVIVEGTFQKVVPVRLQTVVIQDCFYR